MTITFLDSMGTLPVGSFDFSFPGIYLAYCIRVFALKARQLFFIM